MRSRLDMTMSGLLLFGVLALFTSRTVGSPSAHHAASSQIPHGLMDPTGCLSDYQYQTLQSLIHCEERQAMLDWIIHDQEDQIHNITEQIQDLYNTTSDTSSTGGGSATYTRWGKTSCPTHADLVYEGFAAGSLHAHRGGATNLLCLPKDPEWEQYDDNNQHDSAYIYGAEYELNEDTPEYSGYFSTYSHSNPIKQHDVTCAVCCSNKQNVLMLPARTECPAGWTVEYTGYLMAGHWNQDASSQYVCVDDGPEVQPNSGADLNGYGLYFVQGKCDGSLACPPFVEGRELACIVCSK